MIAVEVKGLMVNRNLARPGQTEQRTQRFRTLIRDGIVEGGLSLKTIYPDTANFEYFIAPTPSGTEDLELFWVVTFTAILDNEASAVVDNVMTHLPLLEEYDCSSWRYGELPEQLVRR